MMDNVLSLVSLALEDDAHGAGFAIEPGDSSQSVNCGSSQSIGC